ncbi:oxidized purine nucleoside triphosphate hydrolase-like [Panonychus citri]|uniref:oxidized purine nucleoside triphosphate hydrolase-like n=1 Tax=Panonychus citri TaxID=50023 RepID=UPI002307F934|nr:oxidized purine nucleoside triphosphate hydrolase-like [Panonychus citri]XP_053207377.1 oxidized purine nucleoside triphosphate hydrolase-like [Panonychus citri]
MNRGRKVYNLVLVTDQETNQVLLGYKKRGFGVGIWSGFGGKVEQFEDIEVSVRRELYEESSLIVKEMNKVGILCFDSDTYSDVHESHVYQVTSFSGTPMESEEMKPKWFPIDSIPYHLLWQDFKFWWPYFRSGSLFSGFFMYKGLEYITDHRLITVKDVQQLVPINLNEQPTINNIYSSSMENQLINLPSY